MQRGTSIWAALADGSQLSLKVDLNANANLNALNASGVFFYSSKNTADRTVSSHQNEKRRKEASE